MENIGAMWQFSNILRFFIAVSMVAPKRAASGTGKSTEIEITLTLTLTL